MGQKLGQHFLKDKKILARIAEEAFALNILEIGPGHGELTDALLAAGTTHITAIERDEKLVEQLNNSLVPRTNGKLEIIHGDVREVLPELMAQSIHQLKNFAIVGNIPYYLTGYLLRLLGELIADHLRQGREPSIKSEQLPVTKIVLLVQKEVAERVAARAPRATLLSTIVHGWATPSVLFSVPRGAFSPPPKVDSALLVLEPLPSDRNTATKEYLGAAKIAFRHARKTLTNNIREGSSLPKERAEAIVRELGLPSNARASLCTPSHIKMLAKMVYN